MINWVFDKIERNIILLEGPLIKKSFWKKSILVLTLMSLLAGSFAYYFIPSKPKTEEAYSLDDKRFKAQFPKDPKATAEEMEVANNKIEYHELSVQDKNSLFAVSFIDFPGHWKLLGTDHLLNKSFDGFLESQKDVGEVLQKEITTHNGNPALAYKFKQAGKEIQGKFVIAGNTLYRVAVTYPLAAAQKIKPENFINSFEVLG